MTRLPLILAALTALNLHSTASHAGNAGASLGACYDHVVKTCNANSKRPESCASAGMKACDEYHSNKSDKNDALEPGIQVFRTPGTAEGLRFRVVATGNTYPRPVADPSRDDDGRKNR